MGRTDFVVNVNGNTVDVAEVEDALMSLDGIEDAAVGAQLVPGNVGLTALQDHLGPRSCKTEASCRAFDACRFVKVVEGVRAG